jgi:hypothetical protein
MCIRLASVKPPLWCAHVAAAATTDADEGAGGGDDDGLVDDGDADAVACVAAGCSCATGVAVVVVGVVDVVRGRDVATACCICCWDCGDGVEVASGVMPAAFWKREMMKEG